MAITRSLFCLILLTATTVQGDVHEHIWGSRACGDWSCVRTCCLRTCYERCTYPRCVYSRPVTERTGDCGPSNEASTRGEFGGGGATGDYPDECAKGRHVSAPVECGNWSEIRPKCQVRHCTHRCPRCGSNYGDYFEQIPAGCYF